MAQPRILFIAHSHLFAGAERNLLSIIESAPIGGFEPAALLIPEPGPLSEMVSRLNIPIPLRYVSYHAFRWYHPSKYGQTLGALEKYVEQFQADIIHLNLQILAEFAVQAGRLTHRPVVCHVRNLQTEESLAPLRRWINRTDAILAVSQAVQESLLQGGIATHKVHLVYDSIDKRYFEPPSPSAGLRESLRISEATILLGFIGRVIPEKGIEDLIAAFNTIVGFSPPTHLAVVGDDGQGGVYVEELKHKVARLGLNPRVTFLGFRSDIREILAELDIVIVPSRRAMPEGLPYAVLEALAASKIVIATRNSGVPEVIHDGVNGFLVDCDDVPGLASVMQRALNLTLTARSVMEAAARESVKERTVENQVRQLGELYQELLRTTKRAAK